MTLGRRIKDRVRVFNKHVTNPILGRLAGRRRGPFALVKHVGRRSGRHYQTPIIAVPVADGFVIALTYGSHVDWYRTWWRPTAAGSSGTRASTSSTVWNRWTPRRPCRTFRSRSASCCNSIAFRITRS